MRRQIRLIALAAAVSFGALYVEDVEPDSDLAMPRAENVKRQNPLAEIAGTLPATEWMRVETSASSKVMSGRMEGMQRAISVLPEPGAPTISTL